MTIWRRLFAPTLACIQMGKVMFFCLHGADASGHELAAARRAGGSDYAAEFWSPSLRTPFPPGRHDPRIMAYSGMHAFGMFACPEYSMVMIRHRAGALAHSSMIIPAFARFPFMGANDLQIGATETPPEFRGRGLAAWAIAEIVARHGPHRTYWYLTEAANTASVAVIRKAGFHLAGTGDKQPRFGLRALGYYAIGAPTPSSFERQA